MTLITLTSLGVRPIWPLVSSPTHLLLKVRRRTCLSGLIFKLTEELAALFVPKEDCVYTGTSVLMTQGEGGVLPPAEDDPHNPGETLLAVLEDRVLPERRLRQWQAAGPEEAVTSPM